MTFAEFVTKYLNKRNPQTDMFYMLSDIPEKMEVLTQYINFAREVNWKYVTSNGKPAPDDYLISAWKSASVTL